MSRTTVTVENDVPVPMRDGTILRADVWRSAGASKLPVLLMRTPYNKTRGDDTCMLHPAWMARRGYVVVVQDCRGRWRSDGDFVPFVHEADDTADTVAWAAGLPASNGRVGMYGLSYPGAVQLQGAVRCTEGLVAICPAMTSGDFYEGWTYTNGALSLAFAASWATYLAEDLARRRGDAALVEEFAARHRALNDLYWTLPLSAFPGLQAGELGGTFSEWLGHQMRDEYWRRWDVEGELGKVSAAALVVGGLYDSFLEGTVRAHAKIGAGGRAAELRLLLGPWYHMPWVPAFGAVDFGVEARSTVNEVQLAFFDRWLRDADIADGSPVTAFVTGANRWQTLDDWPPPSSPTTLFLRATSRANSVSGDGRLSEEPPGSEDPDVFSYDPAEPVLSAGGHSCCYEDVAPMGPADQRTIEHRNDVLVYTSAPLDKHWLVAGEIQARLFASTSARDTDWTIRICDVDPAGRSVNVQESIQRARFAAGAQAPRLIPPHEVTRFEFAVGTVSHLFRAGHQVRVLVSSSDFPHWDRNLNTGNPVGVDALSNRVVATQTVFHDAEYPSCVTLPVIADG